MLWNLLNLIRCGLADIFRSLIWMQVRLISFKIFNIIIIVLINNRFTSIFIDLTRIRERNWGYRLCL